MLKNSNGISDENKQKAEEISSEIRELYDGIKSPNEFAEAGTLAPRLKKLIALGGRGHTRRDYGGLAAGYFDG